MRGKVKEIAIILWGDLNLFLSVPADIDSQVKRTYDVWNKYKFLLFISLPNICLSISHVLYTR